MSEKDLKNFEKMKLLEILTRQTVNPALIIETVYINQEIIIQIWVMTTKANLSL